MSKTSKRLAVSTFVAAAAGYVAGVLTAPKSGKETRKDIQQAASKAKTEAERNLKNLHSELDNLIIQGKEKVSDLKSKAKADLVGALATAKIAKEKARELLTALHDGDADDKDLKKAVKDVNKAITHLKKYLAKDGQTKKGK